MLNNSYAEHEVTGKTYNLKKTNNKKMSCPPVDFECREPGVTRPVFRAAG